MTRALPVFRWADAPPDAVIMSSEGATAVAYSESTGRLYVLDQGGAATELNDPSPDFFIKFGESPQDHATSQSWGIIFFLVVIIAATGCGAYLAIWASDAVGRYLQ